MIVRVPEYYDDFSCLAGDCPHSCCEGWEVVLDEETAQLYIHLSMQTEDPLAERLRAALQFDGEDHCFALNGRRCPLLNDKNLCDLHIALGEEATSVTCREHPRFLEDYGPFREISLSASCPKANELLLGSAAPLTFPEREEPGETEEGDPWLSWLLPLRDRMMDILRDRDRALPVRLRTFLLTAQRAQELLDEENMESLEAFAAAPTETMAEPLSAEVLPLMETAKSVLLGLEILEPDWKTLLEQAVPRPVGLRREDTEKLERIAVYFAFRYLLKAVNDGDLLGRAKFCVFAVLVTAWLSGLCGLGEALRLFSREIEHNEENLDALLDSFAWEDGFAPAAFFGAWA